MRPLPLQRQPIRTNPFWVKGILVDCGGPNSKCQCSTTHKIYLSSIVTQVSPEFSSCHIRKLMDKLLKRLLKTPSRKVFYLTEIHHNAIKRIRVRERFDRRLPCRQHMLGFLKPRAKHVENQILTYR